MEFELFNTDGKYVDNIIIDTLDQLLRLSSIDGKRIIEVNVEEKTISLKRKGEEKGF